MTSFNDFKAKARQTFDVSDVQTEHNKPIDFLYSLQWRVPEGVHRTARETAEKNIAFSQDISFGAIVHAAVLCEKLFPHHTLYAGEVCQSYWRDILLQLAKNNTLKWNSDRFIKEVLSSEEPTLVLQDKDGKQFDPLFTSLYSQYEPKHSKVERHDLWNMLHCWYVFSEAVLIESTQRNEYIQNLKSLSLLCLDSVLSKRALFEVYKKNENDSPAATNLGKEIVTRSADVKTTFLLDQLVFGDDYKKLIIKQYNINMYSFLKATITL